jgi:hypothetical protein
MQYYATRNLETSNPEYKHIYMNYISPDWKTGGTYNQYGSIKSTGNDDSNMTRLGLGNMPWNTGVLQTSLIKQYEEFGRKKHLTIPEHGERRGKDSIMIRHPYFDNNI